MRRKPLCADDTPHEVNDLDARGNWFYAADALVFVDDDAIAHDQRMHDTALTLGTALTLRRLAALKPRTLALMHGPRSRVTAPAALVALADYFDAALRAPRSL